MDDRVPSMHLWACAKITARECATINKEYIMCKKDEGYGPLQTLKDASLSTCHEKAEATISCANHTVNIIKENFPVEFAAFVKCLDKNDYRHHDCRDQETALHACWNNKFVKLPSTAASTTQLNH